MPKQTIEIRLLLALTLVALTVSGYQPHDRLTWIMETLPVIIALPLLALTYDRFRFTPLAYRLIFLHALILIVGGHYTYARVPLGFWMQDWFDFTRNHYDRIGHVAQGFIPAIVAREILLRLSPLRRGGWLFFLIVCVCFAISALYELIEWWAALVHEQAAAAFLGTQGDPWDTQWDMFLALCGAILSLLLLSNRHDRELAGLEARSPDAGR
jgi:putative membrane protein